MSNRAPLVINDNITKRFVIVKVGIENYENPADKSVIDIVARLKAESELTPEKWNLFGYEQQPKRNYYRGNLQGCIDVVFIPQKKDEESWRRASISNPSHVFDYMRRVGEACSDTWYLSIEEKGHWFEEVPRFFQISGTQGKEYWGLVLKDFRPREYGERGLDPSGCVHFRTHRTPKRDDRGKWIFDIVDRKELSEQGLFLVIMQAKLVWPYTVKLVHPDDRGRL